MCAQAVVQQGQCIGALRCALGGQAYVGTDGQVLRSGRVCHGQVVGRAVGFGQDAVVGIDQGLQFGQRIHLSGRDAAGGQSAVERRQIRARHALGTRDHVVVERGGDGGLRGIGISLEDAKRGVGGRLRAHRKQHQGLQFVKAVDGAAIVGRTGNGPQHQRQVERVHTHQTQQGQVGGGQGTGEGASGRVGCAGGGEHQALHHAGQGVNLGHGVHIGAAQLGDGAVEQQLGTGAVVQAGRHGGTDQAVVGCRRVGRGRAVCGGTIGFSQDAAVGADDGLHFADAVGLRALHAG